MIPKNPNSRIKSEAASAEKGEKVNSGIRERTAPSRSRQRLVSPKSETFSPSLLVGLEDGFLSRVVNAQDATPEPERHNEGYMHMSKLLKGVCSRQVVFTDMNPAKPIFQTATGGHRVMWKLGRAAEAHVRDSYIRGVKGEGVYGLWRCKCGAHTKAGYYSELWPSCGRCRTAPDNYGEQPFFDHENGIVGNPDFLVRIGEYLYVVEIKSMNGEDFDALQAPMPDHIYQGAGYRRLVALNDFPVAPIVVIIYVTKKFVFGSPYKEFHVNVDKPMYNGILDTSWAKGKLIRQARLNGALPREKVCSSMDSPQAKKCPHVTDCFMRD